MHQRQWARVQGSEVRQSLGQREARSCVAGPHGPGRHSEQLGDLDLRQALLDDEREHHAVVGRERSYGAVHVGVALALDQRAPSTNSAAPYRPQSQPNWYT